MLNPNAKWRLSETLKNLSKVADAEIDVRDMVATIGRHNAVRKLTEEQQTSLKKAAEATVAGYEDESSSEGEDLSPRSSGKKRKFESKVSSPAISSVEAVQEPIMLTTEQEQSRERCVEYLTTFKHDLYLHFKDDCLDVLGFTDSKEMYEAAKITLDELLALVVSDNLRLSSKVSLLTLPMIRGGVNGDDQEHSLNERVSNINTVIGALNPNLCKKLSKVELGTLPNDDDSFFE